MELGVKGHLTVRIPYDFICQEGDEAALAFVQPRINASLSDEQIACFLGLMMEALPSSELSHLNLKPLLIDVGGPNTGTRTFRHLTSAQVPAVDQTHLLQILDDTLKAYDTAVSIIDWVALEAERKASDEAMERKRKEEELRRRPPSFI